MAAYSSVSWAIASAILLSGTAGISAASAQDPMLTDTVWQLEQILYNNDTLAVPENPEDYTIQFFADGTVGIKADCNVGNGTYDVAGGDFISLGAFTLAACGPDSIDDEYRRGLEDAALYFFADGDLYMDLPVDTGTLKFTAADEMAEMAEEEMMTEEIEAAEMVEETVVEPTPEPAPEPEPVRGLW